MPEPPNPYQSPLPPGESAASEPAARPDGHVLFRGALSERQFRTAVRLIRPLRQRIVTVVVSLIVVGPLLASFGIDVFNGVTGQQVPSRLPPFFLGLWLGFSATCLSIWLGQKHQITSLRRLGRGTFRHVEGCAGPDFVDLLWGHRSTLLQWSAFTAWKATDTIIVLFYDEPFAHAQVFARSMFETEADWQAFRALVEEKLPPR